MLRRLNLKHLDSGSIFGTKRSCLVQAPFLWSALARRTSTLSTRSECKSGKIWTSGWTDSKSV